MKHCAKVFYFAHFILIQIKKLSRFVSQDSIEIAANKSMQIPQFQYLPIDKLASVFSSTSATYKFYWFLSILELVEEGNSHIAKRNIFSRMISNSWYTVNYFHISFGKQDLIQDAVRALIKIENLQISENRNTINAVLENSVNRETIRILNHFDKNVPHWFISSWFSGNRNEIYTLSQNFEHDCLYRLEKDAIEINPLWISYLQTNSNYLVNRYKYLPSFDFLSLLLKL